MKIPEAIKELEDIKGGCGPELPESIIALRLGIEALKEIQRARVVSLFPGNHQLQGETF